MLAAQKTGEHAWGMCAHERFNHASIYLLFSTWLVIFKP